MTESTDDVIGKPHPMWLERAGVLALVSGAIFLGRWMWMNEPLSEPLMWIGSICVLPLAVLLLSESWGRFLQR